VTSEQEMRAGVEAALAAVAAMETTAAPVALAVALGILCADRRVPPSAVQPFVDYACNAAGASKATS
jgi:hypothetical protein